MNGSIVLKSEPVTLVGGGEASLDDLALARKLAPEVVAADGGAALCLEAGIAPLAVIGDMDSLSSDLRKRLAPERVHHIAEQDSTDFDKALRNIDAPLICGVGFLGARLDHQLAALNRLVARPDKRIVLIGADDIVFHCPAEIALVLDPETRVSLFPMAEVAGRSTGLEWPIDGIAMHPDQRVGTSNRAKGPVRLTMAGPGMLVLLPRSAFSLAADALLAAAPWPARVG